MSEGQKRDFMLSLCDQMLQALSYLHKKGIIHNDIKHRNIYYIKKEGKHHFALADFGSAKSDINSDFKGALEFISPEKAIFKGFIEANYIDTGFATDLWDLGITLYKLREGKFHLFGKLMRKQFELYRLLHNGTYAYVENANEIIEKIKNEKREDSFIELIDNWIVYLKKDATKSKEMENYIKQVIQYIKKMAKKELQRMATEPLLLIEKDPLECILWHLLQPDPKKRASAESALAILKLLKEG